MSDRVITNDIDDAGTDYNDDTYTDDEIILEFINIFASKDMKDKTGLLTRVLDSCSNKAEFREIIRELDFLCEGVGNDNTDLDDSDTNDVYDNEKENMIIVNTKSTWREYVLIRGMF